jgi:arabinan endo-1,5-alpha-L-arabinosidase
MKTSDIHIRDPYILPLPAEGRYLLFGTTGKNAWSGPGLGFDCYESRDLENWTGPIPAFRPPPDFWSNTQFWAPECHAWQGRYFLFASFAKDERQRGTQILVADRPEGPYRLHSDGPVTPRDWECLDGTLFVDDEGGWLCPTWTPEGAPDTRRLDAIATVLRSEAVRTLSVEPNLRASSFADVRRKNENKGKRA